MYGAVYALSQKDGRGSGGSNSRLTGVRCTTAQWGPAPHSSRWLKDAGAYLFVHFAPLLPTLVLLRDCGGVLSVRLTAFQTRHGW